MADLPANPLLEKIRLHTKFYPEDSQTASFLYKAPAVKQDNEITEDLAVTVYKKSKGAMRLNLIKKDVKALLF